MALRTTICVNGLPPFDRISAIYCALAQVSSSPVVLGVEIINDTQIQITFNQPVIGNSGFSFTVDGVPKGYTYASGSGTEILVLNIAGVSFASGDVVLVSYTPGDAVSTSGTALGAFTNYPVTNPFDQFTYFRPDGVSTYFRPDGVSQYIRP
jgi:hypothetical protein